MLFLFQNNSFFFYFLEIQSPPRDPISDLTSRNNPQTLREFQTVNYSLLNFSVFDFYLSFY
jgi:hypothetical protein